MSDNTALQNDIADKMEAAAPKVFKSLSVSLKLEEDANIGDLIQVFSELGEIQNLSVYQQYASDLPPF